MSTLTAFRRRLADQTRAVPPFAVDVMVTLACYLTVAIYAVLYGHGWWALVLAAGNSLPLLWRRRFPFATFCIVGVTSVGLVQAEALGDFSPGALVSTYTYAALSPPLKRWIAAAGTVVGITLSIQIAGDNPLNLAANAVMFAVAYALGTGARARRDRIAMLEERARRLTEEQDAAATRERERIAREMHDILAHSMSLVVIQAEAGPVAVRNDPDKAEEVFDTISTTAREALAQLRRALGVLRSDEPAQHPPPGLDALPVLVANAQHAGLDATLEERGTRRLVPEDVAATVYRAVQESLTNTVKHAGANVVRVRLDWHDGALDVQVHDDGRGPAALERDDTPGGHGLVGMRERVEAVGGQLTTGPGPDATGFRVAVRLPLGGDQ